MPEPSRGLDGLRHAPPELIRPSNRPSNLLADEPTGLLGGEDMWQRHGKWPLTLPQGEGAR